MYDMALIDTYKLMLKRGIRYMSVISILLKIGATSNKNSLISLLNMNDSYIFLDYIWHNTQSI